MRMPEIAFRVSRTWRFELYCQLENIILLLPMVQISFGPICMVNQRDDAAMWYVPMKVYLKIK